MSCNIFINGKRSIHLLDQNPLGTADETIKLFSFHTDA